MKDLSIASDEEIDESKIEDCVTFITDNTRKATDIALRELARDGVLTRRNIELVQERDDEVVAEIIKILKGKFTEISENTAGTVRLISGSETLELDRTDGRATIAGAIDTFLSGIHGITAVTKITSIPKSKTRVSVYEVITDGTSAEIFGGMSEDLNSLCLTQSQNILFVKKHRKWLRTEGYGTLFLLKVGKEFFVASVYLHSGRLTRTLGIRLDPLSDSRVLRAKDRHRVVIPQILEKQP